MDILYFHGLGAQVEDWKGSRDFPPLIRKITGRDKASREIELNVFPSAASFVALTIVDREFP